MQSKFQFYLFCKLNKLKVFKLQRLNVTKIYFIIFYQKLVENQRSYHQAPYNHKMI